MVDERSQKHLPLYVSYRTFRNFIDGLQQGPMPARIDRSYWGDRLSGSTGTQLIGALRFLGLIDVNGFPTSRLRTLVSSRGENRQNILKETVNEAFGFIMRGSFDPQTATYAQLQETFHNTFQLTSDVSRKCIKFFVALANDAGMPLSPFITKRLRTEHVSTGTKIIPKKIGIRTKFSPTVPQEFQPVPQANSWVEIVLGKFPTFDPTWNDEIKIKWFNAFDELLKRTPD